MRLFQFPHSPFAAKVRTCLRFKGLPFETVDVPYLDRRGLLAVTGGSIQIPVLVDGQTVISDSPSITAYLDRRYAPSMRPGALAGPAVVFEQWADNLLEDVAFRLSAPAVRLRMAAWNAGREDAIALYTVMKERKYGTGCLENWREQSDVLSHQLRDLLAPLNTTLEKQPFLLGEGPTLADAAVYGHLFTIHKVMPDSISGLGSRIAEWFRRIDAQSEG